MSFLAIIAFAVVVVFALTAIVRAETRGDGVWRQEEDDN